MLQQKQEIEEKQHLFGVLYAIDSLAEYMDQGYDMVLTSLSFGDKNFVIPILELKKESMTPEEQININKDTETVFGYLIGEVSLLGENFPIKNNMSQTLALKKENIPKILNLLLSPKIQAVLERQNLNEKVKVSLSKPFISKNKI